jgi:hypothetical protein
MNSGEIMSNQSPESVSLSISVSFVRLDSDNPDQNCKYLCFVVQNALLFAKWAVKTKCAIASGVRCAFVKHNRLALIFVAPSTIDRFIVARSGGNNAIRERDFNLY